MLYTTPKNEMPLLNKQIEFSLVVKEISNMLRYIETEDIDSDKIKFGMNFLTEARNYAEGKESESYEFLPSEAFNLTLKAIDLESIREKNLTIAIDEMILILKDIQNGIFSNSSKVVRFFKQLSKVVIHEKEKPSNLISLW